MRGWFRKLGTPPWLWLPLLVLSTAAYLSIFLLDEHSVAGRIWWGLSKIIGLLLLLASALSLLSASLRRLEGRWLSRWRKKR